MQIQKMCSTDSDSEDDTADSSFLNESTRTSLNSTATMMSSDSLSKSRLSNNSMGSDQQDTSNKNSCVINWPKDCDMSTRLNELDTFNTLILKSGNNPMPLHFPYEPSKSNIPTDGQISYSTTTTPADNGPLTTLQRDMQVLGCLVLELFLPQRFLRLGGYDAAFDTRLTCSLNILKTELHMVPLSIRPLLVSLLWPNLEMSQNQNQNEDSKYLMPPSLINNGLPPLSTDQVLNATVSPIYFPKCFATFGRILRLLNDIEMTESFDTHQVLCSIII